MRTFNKYKSDSIILNEGGNTSVFTQDGTITKADTIPLKEIGRRTFINRFNEVLFWINNQFQKDHNKKLWVDDRLITNAIIFNGSTSFVMSPNYTDEEIIKYKERMGDADVMIPREYGPMIYDTLSKFEKKEVIPGSIYMGNNASSKNKLGNTLICVILMTFNTKKGPIRVPVQLDLELSDFTDNIPTEWASFSHSSSFKDTKIGVKAVHHKYLLRALIGAKSQRDDIVLATPSSTIDKIRLVKRQPDLVRLLQFGVDAGVGQGYEQMKDLKGTPIKMDGKFVYRQKKSSEKSYNKSLDNLFVIAFGDDNKRNKKQMESLYSFMGILELGKKKLTKKEQQLTLDRYFDILFSITGGQIQPIDPDNAQNDIMLKSVAYNKIMEAWGLKRHKNFDKVVNAYIERIF